MSQSQDLTTGSPSKSDFATRIKCDLDPFAQVDNFNELWRISARTALISHDGSLPNLQPRILFY